MMMDQLLYSSLYTNVILTVMLGLQLRIYVSTEMVKERVSELREVRSEMREVRSELSGIRHMVGDIYHTNRKPS